MVDKDPINFKLLAADGSELYSTLPGNPFVKDSNNRVVAYSRMKEDDCFYGFGEKTGLLDKNKTFQRERATDAMGYDAEKMDTLYKHIPFYIRVNEHDLRPVGLFYHNSYDCVFDLGEELSGYWERYCYYQTDGGDIDLFLLAGETLPEILNEYTLLTGRSALPTKQSLGYCASTMYYAELEKELRRGDLQGHRQARKKRASSSTTSGWLPAIPAAKRTTCAMCSTGTTSASRSRKSSLRT